MLANASCRRARRATSLRLSAALVALLLSVAPPARADEAAARARFKRGIELYDQKQYEPALAEFEAAYQEMPSATIKQNIGLTLEAMNAPARAATAFDEALEEGKDTLKPETRAAIERELAELTKTIATMNVTAVNEAGTPAADVTVTIEPAGQPPRQLPPGAALRPIRLMPGIYTFRARAPGSPDPPEKKLALVSGEPVDVTFVFGARGGAERTPGEGTLTVVASVANASIRIDGAEVARGRWTGPVPAGAHSVEVAAPGWKTATAGVVVSAGASVEHSVKLVAMAEAPPEYVAPTIKPAKPREAYLVVSGSLAAASYRLSDDLGEDADGARHPFVGGALGLTGGYLVTRTFAIELSGEVGALTSKYRLRPGDALESRTRLRYFELSPVVRFMSKGKTRLTAATGIGLHGINVESELAVPGSSLEKSGGGVAFAWLVDAGMQADVGPVFLEGALFLDVHGVGPVRGDTSPKDRLLLSSPALRGGLRVGLGIPF